MSAANQWVSPRTKRVIAISWPLMIEMVLASLFGMVDMIVVGNYSGGIHSSAANVTAIGFTNQPVFFALAMIQALGVGSTTLIARAFGAEQYNRLENYVKHSLILGMISSFSLTVLMLFFQETILLFLGAEADTMAAASAYYRFVVAGFFFNCLAVTLGSAIRGVGETRATMYINMIANTLNAIMNVFLVFGIAFAPEMGIAGAGLATAIANVLACILMFYYISTRSKISINWWSSFRFSKEILQQILRFGTPAMGEQLLLRTGVVLYTKIVASLGTVVVAAHQIGLNIYNLSITPGIALGIAASTLVGQSLGAKNIDQARDYAKTSTRFSFVIALMMSAAIYFGRYQLAAFYTNDPAVIEQIGQAMMILVLMCPLQLPQLTEVGALRGAGDTLYPMVATGICVIGVRLATAYVFVHQLHLGLIGAWMSMLVDQVVRFLFIHFRFRSGSWTEIKV